MPVMPAVVTMDNGGQDGARSDHDRDPKANGVNGAVPQGPTKEAREGTVMAPPGAAAPAQSVDRSLEPRAPRMNDLPDEIVHITEGFVPLSLLLTRLAQTTHNQLQDKIAELAKMPLPPTAVNGNSAHPAADDSSNENMRKKATLLNFAQEMHGKWVKALVIAEWSRKAESVSKLIDLKWHIDQQRILYDTMLDQIVHVKRDLTFARMPSPDLKTALQVLSTGSAPWMPDLQYIEPPPLDVEDQLKWMNDLNTLLSLRLNLDEFDKIPPQFKNYEIDSGRVTFRVDGEFEVDLTIADDDFDKQFWFIDFRFSFSPAAATIPESLRGYLESCVNGALAKDGLTGCYQFLHEFVLTCKINELKRQTLQLSKAAWTGTLKVEPLHRALAIQYWTSRVPPTSPKSWVLVAVNSGSKQKASGGVKPASFLEVKWYRDNKVVADVNVVLDLENLSAETLLRDVIGHHIGFILRGIHDKLLGTPRFKDRELHLALDISHNDPAESRLTAQITHSTNVSLLIETKTGVFAIRPNSKFTIQQEHNLNNGTNQIEGGFVCLEDVRCAYMVDEISRRSISMGWVVTRPALKDDEVRSMTKIRDWTRMMWLQRKGWSAGWSLVVVLGLSGDEWWLVETSPEVASRPQRFQLKLPLSKGAPSFSEKFWHRLTVFTTATISQSIDLRVLYKQHIKNRISETLNQPARSMRLPAIDIALSDVLPTMVYDTAEEDQDHAARIAVLGESAQSPAPQQQQQQQTTTTTTTPLAIRQPWAKDIITLRFKTVQAPARVPAAEDEDAAAQRLMCVSEAIVKVHNPSKLASLRGRVDRNVFYDARKGEFHLLMRHPLGEPTLHVLRSRIVAIGRFVCFLEALEKSKDTIQSEHVSLRGVSFFYGEKHPDVAVGAAGESTQRWRVVLDLSKDEVNVELDKGNPHLRVVDLMKRLVNLDGGIRALMLWLPNSLLTMKAIDTIETSWEDLEARGQGRVEFAIKTVDWMGIHYTVRDNKSPGGPTWRQLRLEARIKIRHNEAWWHIWRPNNYDGSNGNNHNGNGNNSNAPRDAFDAALKHVWDGRGRGWQGLGTSAAGKTSGGAAVMLQKVDEVVRGLVKRLNSDEGVPQGQQQPLQQQNGQFKTGKGPEQAIEIV